MTVTFPRPSPTAFGAADLSFGPLANVARAKNPWSFHDIVQVYDGAMWQGSLTVYPFDAAAGRGLAAWLASLGVYGGSGPLGTFLLGDPSHPTPRGAAKDTPGTPVVKGAGQSGFALLVEGLPVSTTDYLLEGDYFQLASGATAKLHMVVEDADSDGFGESTLSIWPPLRSSPADQDPLVVSGAEGVFSLAAGFTPWRVRPARVYEPVSLPVQEYLA